VLQLPEVGWVMLTDVAVTGSPNVRLNDGLDDFFVDFLGSFPVGLPVAVMHVPAVTAEALTLTVCWNVVVGV
jgi:hypothetical protein